MFDDEWEAILMAQIFKALQTTTIDAGLIVRLVDTITHLEKKLVKERYRGTRDNVANLVTEIACFCCNYAGAKGWLEVVVSAVTLGRVTDLESWDIQWSTSTRSGVDIPGTRSCSGIMGRKQEQCRR